MKTIKVLVEDEVWEKFYRLFPSQGERTQLLRNFILQKIFVEKGREKENE